MVNSKIVLRGTLDREPKENEDGSVDLILTNVIEENSPKKLKEKGDSVFLVKLTEGMWKKSRKKLRKENTEFSIVGGVKASVNKKGMPFIYVHADNVLVKKKKIEISVKDLDEEINTITRKVVPWFKNLEDEDFIEIAPEEVLLVEEDHLEAKFKYLNFEALNKRQNLNIAVRKLENGKYALVSGINNFMVGKMFNRNYRAYVTELEREDFIIKFEIKENEKVKRLKELKKIRVEKKIQNEEEENIQKIVKETGIPKGTVKKYINFK